MTNSVGTNDLDRAVVEAERATDRMQQAVYERDTTPGYDSGYSRAWKAEYAMREQGAAMGRAYAELDAAGVIDLASGDVIATVNALAEWLGLAPVGCIAEHYRLNNGRDCGLPVYKDGECEDHYWKTQEALAEREQEQRAALASL